MDEIADMYFEWSLLDNDLFPSPAATSCRCCSEGNLFWREIDGKWRLFNDRGIHKCPVQPLPGHERVKR